MAALAIWTPEDGLLGAIAPLGLAAAAGTALVVDLDPDGPRYPGMTSLAALVEEGPRRSDLEPRRRGLAVMSNGGVRMPEAAPVVEALLAGWPHLVLRLPPRPVPEAPIPIVPVHPLLPGSLRPVTEGAAVYQRTGFGVPAPGPGPLLPVPAKRTIDHLLRGILGPPDRWRRAWSSVWEWPWA